MCYGYDCIMIPGFAEAGLQRVDESLTTEARQYLTESLAYQKKVKEDNAKKYGNMLCEGVTVHDMDCGDVKVPEYIKEAINKPYDIDELSKPLNEDDSADEDFTLPMTDTNPLSVTEDDDKDSTEDGKSEEKKTKKPDSESKDDSESTTKEEKHELTDEEKKSKRAKFLNVEAIDADGEGSTEAEKE